MTAELKILVTCGGRRVQLVRALRLAQEDEGLPQSVAVGDASNLAPAGRAANKFFQLPRLDDPAYIARLLQTCREEGIGLVVPTIDTELLTIAHARPLFDEIGCQLAVSSVEVIELAASKTRSGEWLACRGFATPRRWERRSGRRGLAEIGLPAVVKPDRGSRSVGLSVVRDLDELANKAQTEQLIVEEYVEGEEYTVSAYVDVAGKCISTVPRQRIEVRDGEVIKALTVHDPQLESLVARIAESLPGAKGPINVQVIRSARSGELKVIEINPRFGGGDPLAWHAGAVAPRWLVREALGRRVEADRWTSGLYMLRFDQAAYVDQDGRVSFD